MTEEPQPRESSRQRRRFRYFLWLLNWNLVASSILSVPLWLLTSTAIALPFIAIMVFMSLTLAGYFAFIRLE